MALAVGVVLAATSLSSLTQSPKEQVTITPDNELDPIRRPARCGAPGGFSDIELELVAAGLDPVKVPVAEDGLFIFAFPEWARGPVPRRPSPATVRVAAVPFRLEHLVSIGDIVGMASLETYAQFLAQPFAGDSLPKP